MAELAGNSVKIKGEIQWIYESVYGRQFMVSGIEIEGRGRIKGKALIETSYPDLEGLESAKPGYEISGEVELGGVHEVGLRDDPVERRRLAHLDPVPRRADGAGCIGLLHVEGVTGLGRLLPLAGDSLEDLDTFNQTYDLCGPRAYTLIDLVNFVAQARGLKSRVIPLCDRLSYLNAWAMEFKPGNKPMTRVDYYAMQLPNVCDGNAPPAYFQAFGQDVDNTQEDRQRGRVRLRLGLNANVVSGVDAGIRITTGNTSDPVSTNQTLGTYDNKYSLVLDRAYLRLTPLEGLSISGGRIPNPFFSTDLVWDDDLNFEGVAATFRPWPDAERVWRPFVTAGVFPLQEIDENGIDVRAEDKWLFGIQGGAEWMPSLTTRVKAGASYYDYRNIAGIRNPTPSDTFYDETAPRFRQKGNSLFDIDPGADDLWALAADYRIANLTLVADFAWQQPLHAIGSIDWARNVGFDRTEILARTGQDIEPETDGYQVKLTVGYPKVNDFEKWQAFVGYRYLERDAVLDAFTDSDFHLGGTNAEGFFVGGAYGLYKNTWLSARWMSADEISGLPLSIDVFQLDLNATF